MRIKITQKRKLKPISLQRTPQGELKIIILWLSLQYHEVVGNGNICLIRGMFWWASIVLTTTALVQTSLTDTTGRYFTYCQLETVIRFKRNFAD